MIMNDDDGNIVNYNHDNDNNECDDKLMMTMW